MKFETTFLAGVLFVLPALITMADALDEHSMALAVGAMVLCGLAGYLIGRTAERD